MTRRTADRDDQRQIATVHGSGRLVVLTPGNAGWTATIIGPGTEETPVDGTYASVSTALLAGLKAEREMPR